jgi:hypothetical protein
MPARWLTGERLGIGVSEGCATHFLAAYQVTASGPANTIPAGSGIFLWLPTLPSPRAIWSRFRAPAKWTKLSAGATYVFRITSTFPTGGPPAMMSAGNTNTELLYNAQIDLTNTFTLGVPTILKKGKATVS